MKPKVCILTTVHPPFDTRIFHKQAKTLVREGYDVTLIAQWSKDEIVDGVKIIALPTPRNRLTRFFGLTWRAFRLALQQKADIYHFHDPELIPFGTLLKFYGKRVVYDVHEDLPKQVLNKEWIPKYFRQLAGAFINIVEKMVARFFDAIVPAEPAVAERLYSNKMGMVQNFPILNELLVPSTTAYSKRPKGVIYVGGITRIRGICEMVEAIDLVPDELGANLVLVGEFISQSLKTEVLSLPGWKRTKYYGWQDRTSVAQLLGNARAGIVVLNPTPKYLEAWPTKLFEYMSAALPVIASDFPLYREIVEKAQCGLLVDPLDPENISNAIQWILENPREAEAMGQRGQKAVVNHYNWNAEALKLIDLYQRLI